MCVERFLQNEASFSYKIGGGGLISYKIGGGGIIFLQNWRRKQGFGNITGSCSDMVWILVRHQFSWLYAAISQNSTERDKK